MSTAKDLREAREAAGLSMKQAAENSGTPYRTWQSWETEGRGFRVGGVAAVEREELRREFHGVCLWRGRRWPWR